MTDEEAWALFQDRQAWALFQDRHGLYDIDMVDGTIHVTAEQWQRLSKISVEGVLPQQIDFPSNQFMAIKVEKKNS